jgi:hypothetical protein
VIAGSLVETADILKSEGVSVVGMASDADAIYNEFGRVLFESIQENFDACLPLKLRKIVRGFQPVHYFFDLLHLSKRDRYRRLQEGAVSMISFMTESGCLSRKDLVDLGLPTSVLDNAQARKQEDELAKQLFSFSTLQKAAETDKDTVFVALLPSVCATQAVFNKDLAVSQRVLLLNIAFSVVFAYTMCSTSCAPLCMISRSLKHILKF